MRSYINKCTGLHFCCHISIIKDQNVSQTKYNIIIICFKRMFNPTFKSYAFNNAQLLPFYKCINHTERTCSLLPWVAHTA